MKLVLYSGGQLRSNHHLHRALVELAVSGKRNTKKLSLTYIPFCSDDSNLFFHRAVRRYQAHGVEAFKCLNVDNSPTIDAMNEALKSDIIYLAGGNTFYFLKHLRESGMLARLKTFAETGGVLAGLSAGGLILSPTVKSAAEPSLGPDENEVKLKNFKGLGLFPFEFSPHFERTSQQVKAHLKYSTHSPHPIYAVEDGAGIIIDGPRVMVRGKASLFYQGSELILPK